MSVFERIASRRRRDEQHAASTTAICVRCQREYKPEPGDAVVAEHCWWCAARVSQPKIAIVTD